MEEAESDIQKKKRKKRGKKQNQTHVRRDNLTILFLIIKANIFYNY